MFNLTKFSIEKTRVSICFVVILLLLGLVSYQNLPRSEDPGFTNRKARVVTLFPGATPARVESLITDKLEEAISEIPEVETIWSDSKTGSSVIILSIKENFFDMQPIWDTLRKKVERVVPDLPKEIIGPIVDDEFGDVFGTFISIRGNDLSYRELKAVADEVRDQFLFLEDVEKVEIYGEQKERIYIEYDDAQLARIKVSAAQIINYFSNRNIITPGGRIFLDHEVVVLEPTGNFESLEELKNAPMKIPGRSESIYLKDFAKVSRGYIDPPHSKMIVMGDPSLGLAISLKEDGDILRLGKEVKVLLEKIKREYPIGIDFDLLLFQPSVVAQMVNNFTINLVQSILLVILVVVLFLGTRVGLISAGLIPLTVLISFYFMELFGVTINIVSMSALIMALGLLIDNGIVVAETIFYQAGRGKPLKTIAIEAVKELKFPLLVSSLTTCFAFLPIYLAKSSTGEYTGAIFSVLTIALMISWFLSITILPALCVRFLQPEKIGRERKKFPLLDRYTSILNQAMHMRYRILIGCLLIVCGSIYGFRFIPNSFFPQSDRPLLSLKIELPKGTKIERTEEVVLSLSRHIDQTFIDVEGEKKIKSWVAFIGTNPPKYVLNMLSDTPTQNFTAILINLTDHTVMQEVMKNLESFLSFNFPEATVSMNPVAYGPAIKSPIELSIASDDIDKLYESADEFKLFLKSFPETKNVRDNWGERSKKISVDIDSIRALRSGVSHKDIAISLQTKLKGIDVSLFREGSSLIPITVRSVAEDRGNIERLNTLSIHSPQQIEGVPLGQVAELNVEWEAGTILRKNRSRTIKVSSDLLPGAFSQKLTQKIVDKIELMKEKWPELKYEIGGEADASGEARGSLISNFYVALALIIFILVLQFNSFLQPFIIFLSIFTGLIGVLVGLLITGSSMGFMPFLGLLSLSGIIINNAIMIIERIKLEEEAAGDQSVEIIVHASKLRVRPILMTMITTIGGMLPLCISGGALFQTMGIVIVFGLLSASFLTLIFVPVAYATFNRIKNK